MKKKILNLAIALMMVITLIAPSHMNANAATATLLNTYGSLFGAVGNCVSLSQLQNQTTLSAIKQQYNSITLENEMKPDYILGSSANLISKDQAKTLGYYIPSNYSDTMVPKLNFDTIDKVMQICSQNGLKMRAHTLVWHSQTPSWYFKTGFSGSGSYVSKSVMDARLEWYVKTMINHVYNSQYGDCVYAWDIVNEYLHGGSSNWTSVYGQEGNSPSFVKKAFQYANDALVALGKRSSVKLFNNDYNTYMEISDMIAVCNFINSSSKICDGVGMQAHLDTGYPSPSLFKQAVKSFCDAGLEVQITEFDATNTSASTQATYCYDIMKGVLEVKKAGGNITGFTIWGLYDSISWRSSQSPTLFSGLTTPKASYNSVLQAYTDAGYSVGDVTTPTNPTTTPTPTATPTVTPTATPTPTSTPATGNSITASMKVENSWGNGGQICVTLTNTGAAITNNWKVEFDSDIQGVTNSWGDGNVTSCTNGHVVIENQSWVQGFASGASMTVYMQYSGTAPTTITNVTIQ